MALSDSDTRGAAHQDSDSTAMELYNADNPEHKSLRKVRGPLPWLLFAVCVIEMGERFVYIGLSGPLQNYIK